MNQQQVQGPLQIDQTQQSQALSQQLGNSVKTKVINNGLQTNINTITKKISHTPQIQPSLIQQMKIQQPILAQPPQRIPPEAEILNIEIEARLGKLITEDENEKKRIEPDYFLIGSECIVEKNKFSKFQSFNFESEVTDESFTIFRGIMGDRFQSMKSLPLSNNKKIEISREKKYEKHINSHKGKVRVIYEDSTNSADQTLKKDEEKWLSANVKNKYEEINFHSPHHEYDFRIQVSSENDVNVPDKNSVVSLIRKKDRTSYKIEHGFAKIDTTIVETFQCDSFGKEIPQSRTIGYEVEVEFDSLLLYNERKRLDEKKTSKFSDYCKTMLTIIRTMNGLCTPTKQRIEQYCSFLSPNIQTKNSNNNQSIGFKREREDPKDVQETKKQKNN